MMKPVRLYSLAVWYFIEQSVWFQKISIPPSPTPLELQKKLLFTAPTLVISNDLHWDGYGWVVMIILNIIKYYYYSRKPHIAL